MAASTAGAAGGAAGAAPASPTVRPASPPRPISWSPSFIGKYRIERTIGEGTYGKVKLGVNVHTNERVRAHAFAETAGTGAAVGGGS